MWMELGFLNVLWNKVSLLNSLETMRVYFYSSYQFKLNITSRNEREFFKKDIWQTI